ncbi:hypothetical protein ACFFK0_02200 [Paenibacillus chartarius]|uniref:DUF7847 domain-containing protein n=1 Tax=Paenibacillus chartarius TaxID=747481 RepID=A0ABV6DF46_9BACL
MHKAIWRPLSVGRVIDRGFQLYRTYFVKLMMIVLMTYGPFYLLSLLVQGGGQEAQGSLLGSLGDTDSLMEWVESFNNQNASMFEGWRGIVYVLVIIPIGVFFLFPLATGAVVGLVHHAVHGEDIPSAWTLVKRSLKRIGLLAGSTFLFSLMFIAVYAAAAGGIIGLMIAVFAGGGLAGGGAGSNVALGIVLMLLFFLFLFALVIVLVWLAVRWGYFLPFVALGEEKIGFRRSWRLTKRNFWRMLLMWIVVGGILNVITMVFQLLIIAVLGGSIFGSLLEAIVSMLAMPIYMLPYVVSFYDLRARNEGYGLEELIRRTLSANQVPQDPQQDMRTESQELPGLQPEEWRPKYE